ncbi:protein phosphatase 2A regulatory subunit PR55 [Kipferlia bialata]|uniref:Protein phosphatase 2A regulatory subunit PR55 n=1 Tax=Kipferlia bialata TaxID=797122 RepID=A0A9K3CXW4_9EUKA|nr:protein phosphatase 2A regulatory subunit PR55 [Kipferlia bialata]|eukprot:g6662.t1
MDRSPLSPSGQGAHELPDWKFCQVFGDNNPTELIQDDDVISQIRFNQDGKYLAAGDMGGRIVVFERIQHSKPYRRRKNKVLYPNVEYSFFFEFQSHEPEFDNLRSIEIDEKVRSVASH